MLPVLFWKSLVSTFSVFSFAPVWCHVHWCQLCFPGVSSSLILSCVFKSSVSYFTLKFACACLVSVLVFMLGYAPARPALFCVHAFSLINCSLFVILSFFSSASAWQEAWIYPALRCWGCNRVLDVMKLFSVADTHPHFIMKRKSKWLRAGTSKLLYKRRKLRFTKIPSLILFCYLISTFKWMWVPTVLLIYQWDGD